MFTKVLVPLDRSALAEQAVGAAAAIARASHATMDLVLIHQVLPFDGFTDAPWNAEQVGDEEKYLATIATELSSAGVTTTHHVEMGDPTEKICERAREIDADLIVMTSHGRTGLSRLWVGSVADGVIRRAAVPVLMLRPQEGKGERLVSRWTFKKILVPLDGSAFALEVLANATAMAHSSGARIVLIRVVQPVPLITGDAGMAFVYPMVAHDDVATRRLMDEAKQELVDTARALGGPGQPEVETHVIVDTRVAQAIIDYARVNAIDAIAMSTHGRGASRLFVGSVADKVLRASDLPMLLRRPESVRHELSPVDAEGIARQLPALATAH